ncbi:MAG: chemotaxis protein CheW [Rubrivivax sp.]|nr:chemotaxis protein CheW [Rubrivivax sp.]
MSANMAEEVRAVAAKALAAPREVLTLRLGGEEYGIDILRVQEIRSYEQPTRLAGAPPHVLGVTNLRGVIVPIVDLRCRFGLDVACGSDTVTVVLAVGGRTVGAVVDAVSDVVALTPAQIKPAPAFSGVIDAGHITGIATLGDGERARMLILLDIEQLMSGADMGLAAQALL